MASQTRDGVIEITQKERKEILNGIDLLNSTTNDAGQKVMKPFQMCGFTAVNIPIMAGILLTQPTLRNTLCFQWLS